MSDTRGFLFLLLFGGIIIFSIALCAITIVYFVSTNLIKEVRLKVQAEKDLALSRFEFEKQLALVRVKLERNAQQSKHQADFAEAALANFHEAKLLLADLRWRAPNASRTYSDYRAVKQGLDEHAKLEQFFKSQRHGAFALFGVQAASCFAKMIDVIELVRSASNHLSEAEILDQTISVEQRKEYENIIWRQVGVKDSVAARVEEIMEEAYRVFGTALNAPFAENTDG